MALTDWISSASRFAQRVFARTEDSIPKPQGLADWMGNSAELDGTKFTDLLLPGTHDSGAHKIDWDKRPPFLNKWWQKALFSCVKVPVVGDVVRNIVERWTLTQKDDIKTQLENGVRLFDFRLGYDEKGEKYISHTFLCEKLDTVLDQIKHFQQQHPSEVLTLNFKMDFPYRDGAKEGFEHDCMRMVVDKLGGERIISTEHGLTSTLGELKGKGHFIINLNSDKPMPDDLTTKIRQNQTEELWVNQSRSREVAPELARRIGELPDNPEKLTYAGYMATPAVKKIVRGAVNGRSLAHSAGKLEQRSDELLNSEGVAKPGKVSGFIADMVSPRFVDKVVKHNKTRGRSHSSRVLADRAAAEGADKTRT